MTEPDSSRPETTPAKSEERDRYVFARDLLGDAKEVKIVHNDEIYRLRLTKSGKLILHK